MLITNTKNDKLTLNTYSAWPYYPNLADVPKEYMDQVKAGSIFRLMVLSIVNLNGADVIGLYGWNGTSWHTVAQANIQNIEHGTTAQRPTNYISEGRVYFDKTLNKQIYYNGVAWVAAADGSPA